MKTQSLYALQSKKNDMFFKEVYDGYEAVLPSDVLHSTNLPHFFTGEQMFKGVRDENTPWTELMDHTKDDVLIVEFSVRLRTTWDVEQTFTKAEEQKQEDEAPDAWWVGRKETHN